MASGSNGVVLREVGRLFGGGTVAGLGEGQLLERFRSRRDDSAFEALVARHGPMVLGVCRRWLRDEHEVEDAFQATFLVLVRKAGTIRDGDRLGPWLYGVAHRTAARARARTLRRRSCPLGKVDPMAEVAGAAAFEDLGPILDEEVGRLPEKYRAPIVLCYLEGLTHDEAARRLAWPVGTVRGRLARARERLRERLTRRGLAPSASLAGLGLKGRARALLVPPALQEQTVRAALSYAAGPAAAAGAVSATAVALSGGVIRAMFLTKLKVAAVTLMTGVVATGAAVRATQQPTPSADTLPTPATTPAPPAPPAPARTPAPPAPPISAALPATASSATTPATIPAPPATPAPPAPPAFSVATSQDTAPPPGTPVPLPQPGAFPVATSAAPALAAVSQEPPAPPAAPGPFPPPAVAVGRNHALVAPTSTDANPINRSEHARRSLERTRREVEEAITGLNQEIKDLTTRLNRAQVELRRLERVRQALESAKGGDDENLLSATVNQPLVDQPISIPPPPQNDLAPMLNPNPPSAPNLPADHPDQGAERRLQDMEKKLDRLMRALDEIKGRHADRDERREPTP